MSGAEQTRKSWRYPGDKLNRNLLGHAGRGLARGTIARAPLHALPLPVATSAQHSGYYSAINHGKG